MWPPSHIGKSAPTIFCSASVVPPFAPCVFPISLFLSTHPHPHSPQSTPSTHPLVSTRSANAISHICLNTIRWPISRVAPTTVHRRCPKQEPNTRTAICQCCRRNTEQGKCTRSSRTPILLVSPESHMHHQVWKTGQVHKPWPRCLCWDDTPPARGTQWWRATLQSWFN